MSVAKPAIRFRAYDLIAQAVETGVAYGWRRAHKHVDKPEEQKVQEEIESAVMGALCEIMDFES